MVPTNRTEGRIQGSKEGQGPLRYRMKVLQEEFIKKCYCKTVSLITKIIGIVSSIKLRCPLSKFYKVKVTKHRGYP